MVKTIFWLHDELIGGEHAAHQVCLRHDAAGAFKVRSRQLWKPLQIYRKWRQIKKFCASFTIQFLVFFYFSWSFCLLEFDLYIFFELEFLPNLLPSTLLSLFFVRVCVVHGHTICMQASMPASDATRCTAAEEARGEVVRDDGSLGIYRFLVPTPSWDWKASSRPLITMYMEFDIGPACLMEQIKLVNHDYVIINCTHSCELDF